MSKAELRVIEGNKGESVEAEPHEQQESARKYGAQQRWTQKLGRNFTPVSDFFLANYHRLRPHPNARGLNSGEAMLIVQLVSFKRDKRAPFPSQKLLAKRMGIEERMVREHIKNLAKQGYLQRERRTIGGVNVYHLEPLFEALERMMDADAEKPEAS
jgi:DNA-binding MarR family transcriptional regulator